MRKIAKFFFVLGLLGALMLSTALAAEAQPLLSLEQFQALAREQGRDLKQLDLSRSQAELSLAIIKGQYGVGSYYDSKMMKADMEQLENFIEERLQAIKLLEESIAQWKAEKEDPEADAAELERLIAQANRDIAEYQREVDEIRPAYVSLVLRHLEAKSREDLVEPQLKPHREAVEQLEDALAQQPKLLDYTVEQLFLGLLTLSRQEEVQKEALELARRALEIEERKQSLGLSTHLMVKAARENLVKSEEALQRVRADREKYKRELLYLAGLPLDFKFEPLPVDLAKGHILAESAAMPDFTTTLSYRRAFKNLQDALEDLEDTSPFDRNEYRLAELRVEEAELKLNKTLEGLQKNYLSRKESLRLAMGGVDNAAFSLEQAERSFRVAEVQFALGMLSPLELERARLALRQAELAYHSALVQRELAFRAYLLALEGMEVPNPAGV